MPSPTARQSHIDAAMTNISIGYTNAMYVYDQVFPTIPVKKISDKFFTFPKAAWLRDESAVRAPGTRAKVAEYTLSTTLYTCVEKALAKLVTDDVIENSDNPLQPMVTATKFVTDQIMKSVEIDVIGLVFGTGWASSATPGTLWSSDAADPLGDIETGMNQVASVIGREPNTGVIGRGLWRYLKNHPDVVDRLKYGGDAANPAKVSLNGVAALAGLEKLLLTSAIQDTGNEGQAASTGYIGGLHMWLGWVSPSAALDEPSAGYTFSLMDRQINKFRDDPAHTWIIEARQSWDAAITASDAGYLIKAAA